ncbi:MAG: PA2779 family protein [Elusimicrobia bacterium]|nr:PA2779 family protein [Elusimicrobiota bacterium]
MNRKSSFFLRGGAVAMALLTASMSVGVPRAKAMMAPTETAVAAAGADRTADMKIIQSTLENRMVSQRLKDMGLSTEQINQKLAGLSDAQVHRVAMQIEKQNPAADDQSTALTILIAVAVVALIIWLWDRL